MKKLLYILRILFIDKWDRKMSLKDKWHWYQDMKDDAYYWDVAMWVFRDDENYQHLNAYKMYKLFKQEHYAQTR